MSKKQPKHSIQDLSLHKPAQPPEQVNEVPREIKQQPSVTSTLLADVRKAAMRASADTAHNIAELESWRTEIDATIAFLRAQRK